MQLRPYQETAVEAAMGWMRRSVEPCLIDAAPAAGKSYMIAAIARDLHAISNGKRILALAPSAELVLQNHGKYLLTGNPASIFSASAGAKSTRHPVVFATPGTVARSISRFLTGYIAVVVDECHGITPTIRKIIDAMREANPNLRVLGLSGTPFRMGSGYVYREEPNGKTHGDDKTRDPYFAKCVCRVSAREMLDQKFITPMTIGQIHSAEGGYDVSNVVLLPNGHFDERTVEAAFVGHGRKTAAIVADVIEQSRGRSGGIMYFAASIQHAREIIASLPPTNSGLVTGDECVLFGRPASRKAVIAAYREQKCRHLVSVGTLTTGFDVEHTEVIALLRYTESPSLLQQILGRAWRLHAEKSARGSLLLDYAENLERHFPDGDIYAPMIRVSKIGEASGTVKAECPECHYENLFSMHKDASGYQLDTNGYCLDVFGERIETDFGPMPGHNGRRCFGLVETHEEIGKYDRCGYRWTGKACPHCEELNDIAARYCFACKGELVDPNKKLISEFKAMKRDPTQVQTDEIISMEIVRYKSTKGNDTVRADWKTPWRQFSSFHLPNATFPKGMKEWRLFCEATDNGNRKPDTITYRKDPDTSFYRVFAFDKEIQAP